MKFWNGFPMLRLIVPFVAGVIFMAFGLEIVPFEQIHFIGYAIIVLFFLVVLIGTGGKTIRPYRFGIATIACLFFIGASLTISVSDHLFLDNISRHENLHSESTFLIRISDQPQEKDKSIKVVAEIVDSDITANGKVLLYFSKDSLSRKLKHGNILVLNTKLDRVKGMGNPNEFNYARYLRFHNLLFRGYVKNDGWKLLSEGKPSLKKWFLEIRSHLVDKLKDARLDGNELSVASALILGYRAEIDNELMSAYAGAGATHVLAVSGLHVGIVYVILNSIFGFLDRSKYGKLIKTIILIILLFGYAALTGLSASVFRAATMFSFVAIGKAINRSTNIFNTLAASAFCLILYDPMIVMQVGFQLSYAAVIGIVLVQPKLLNLLTFNNRFFEWAWSITCVSIAAQLATFSLGLLYFHQFPNLFLLSNLLVIPAAGLILYLGFTLFAVSFWQPTLLFLGVLLNYLIETLNKVVSWIEKIPYSVLEGIDISILDSLLIYGIIICALLFISQKNFTSLRLSLVLSVCFLTLQIAEVYQQKNQEFLTIYNVRGETAVAFAKENEVTFLSSSELWDDKQRMLFHVQHHWWNKGIDKEFHIPLSDSLCNRSLNWNGNHFSIIRMKTTSPKAEIAAADSLDFIIVDNLGWNQLKNIEPLVVEHIYISNSLGAKTKQKLLDLYPERQFHDLAENGAITLGQMASK